ncbi:MAG: hypothetical protein F6K39_43590 [Okeania sp. SIO3B3]|nr:hypothetical protein [Okeania sp. SIO3B3]
MPPRPRTSFRNSQLLRSKRPPSPPGTDNIIVLFIQLKTIYSTKNDLKVALQERGVTTQFSGEQLNDVQEVGLEISTKRSPHKLEIPVEIINNPYRYL